MNINKQTIIVGEIIDIFEKYEISGIDGISILEFIKYHILKGDLVKKEKPLINSIILN